MERVSLKILAENRVENPLLIAEQGLSIYVSVDDKTILFDTGQRNAVMHNAGVLGIDLTNLAWIVISHGHYDHTGGLDSLIKISRRAKLIAHPYLFQPKYVEHGGNLRFIGAPLTTEDLKKIEIPMELSQNPVKLTSEIIFSGEIKRLTDYEKVEDHYHKRVLESVIHDQMKDEAALIIDTPEGLIILSGCGHSGIINTCKYALTITGKKKILLVMGGMHLKNADDSRLKATIHDLKDINPEQFAPLHCTGFQMIKELISEFGNERVHLMNVGDELTFSFQ